MKDIRTRYNYLAGMGRCIKIYGRAVAMAVMCACVRRPPTHRSFLLLLLPPPCWGLSVKRSLVVAGVNFSSSSSSVAAFRKFGEETGRKSGRKGQDSFSSTQIDACTVLSKGTRYDRAKKISFFTLKKARRRTNRSMIQPWAGDSVVSSAFACF